MKKATRFLVPLLMTLVILASIVWYLFDYDRDFTRDTLLGQARFQDTHGNSRLSSVFYNMAYSFSGKDENVAIELANQYKGDGNFTKAEYTLTNAINSGATVELYTALCLTYAEQDKLLDAVSLLDNITDPNLKARLDALRPSAPNTDYPAGYYNQYMDIHLSSTGDAIFYTADGDFPTMAGPVYDGGISLPTGETTIYAIAVDSNGLVSPVTVLSYTITGVIEPVTFVDAQMEAAIRALVKADADDIVYTNQLWEILEFTAPADVKDFADIQQLPYLKKLTIQGQKLDGLENLSSLANLEELSLSGCRFPADDLAILANLPSLVRLDLSDCGLSTIAGLANAENLTYLNLNSNTVRNLDVISQMSSLQELHLSHNAVTDLADLSTLHTLEKLDVSYNSLTTLKPLASCVKLNWLNAGGNQLGDLAGVESLVLLEHLAVDHNKIDTVYGISECTELKELDISSNAITDIGRLGSLGKLEVLDFSDNQISALPKWPDNSPLHTINGSNNALTSVDSLKNLNSLANLNLDYNELTSIDVLADNYCLVYVNVYGNDIEDVSKLREHDIIVNYDPTK